MVRIFVFLLFATLMLTGKSQPPSKIYLIRHAKVDIKNPGWGNSNAGDFGQTVPLFSVKQCHFERCYNNTKIFSFRILKLLFSSIHLLGRFCAMS